jgi:hypothetical protein
MPVSLGRPVTALQRMATLEGKRAMQMIYEVEPDRLFDLLGAVLPGMEEQP